MFDEIPLPLDWPVYVSHAEAARLRPLGRQAIADRSGVAARGVWHSDGVERAFPWGAETPGPRARILRFRALGSCRRSNAFPRGRSAFGVDGLLANGWEWTVEPRSSPSRDSKPFPFYEGYSANFFDGKHYVMKGGSPRTDRSMLRRSFRNWFQPHYPYVYAGFRCAE